MSGIASIGAATSANIRPSFRGESCQQVCDDGSCSVVCPPEEKKHGSVLGFIVKTLITAGIVAGGLALARSHTSLKEIDLTKELANDAKFVDKVKYYTAKAGEFVKEQWGKLVKCFKKDETPKGDGDVKPADATPTAETPTEPPKTEDKK